MRLISIISFIMGCFISSYGVASELIPTGTKIEANWVSLRAPVIQKAGVGWTNQGPSYYVAVRICNSGSSGSCIRVATFNPVFVTIENLSINQIITVGADSINKVFSGDSANTVYHAYINIQVFREGVPSDTHIASSQLISVEDFVRNRKASFKINSESSNFIDKLGEAKVDLELK